jgi:hypothetical protein
MGAYTLVSPCYSQNGTNPSANDTAGAQVPCDSSQSDCVDNNGVPCSDNGQPVSAIIAEGYPVTGSSTAAAQQTGAAAAASSSTGGGTAISTSGLGIFTSLAADASQAYAASVQPVKPVGVTTSSGLSLGSGSSTTLLLLGGLAIVAFLVFGGKKKLAA